MEDSESLRDTLERLHEDLESADAVDPEIRSLLEDAAADIRKTLGSTDQSSATEKTDRETLAGRLEDAARHFEESHPAIAGTLERLVDILGQMGI